jgi:predicted acetyltransferase
MMRLVRPATEHLAAYMAALRRGWSPNTTRPEAAGEELQQIAADAAGFLAWMDDPEGRGPLVTLPDGQRVQRLPGLRRWMWSDAPGLADDERFVGGMSLRWAADRGPLPSHVLGHVGYAVVPWHNGRGHATAALGQMLDIARAHGLPFVELTTDPENLASQRVIAKNGGVLLEHFIKDAAYGGTPGLRFRIDL